MERALRNELKALSTELLGGPNRYRALVSGSIVNSGQVTASGRPIKVVEHMTEESVLEMLRQVKRDLVQEGVIKSVQEQAGGSAE